MEWLTTEPDPVAELLARARDAVVRQAAAGYLTRCGLRILAQDWRCSEGTIDVLAAEGRVLVICDIRVRTSHGRFPAALITRARTRQLRGLGVRWLTAHGVLFHEIRIDIIELTKDPDGGFAIEHIAAVA
jgi:putative endonuclease